MNVIYEYLKALPILDSLVMTGADSSSFSKLLIITKNFGRPITLRCSALRNAKTNIWFFSGSASGSGSFVGYKCNANDNQCTMEKFDQQDDAYSLCSYTGNQTVFQIYYNMILGYLNLVNLMILIFELLYCIRSWSSVRFQQHVLGGIRMCMEL